MTSLCRFFSHAALAVAAYFAPVMELCAVVLAFVAVDLVLGLVASARRHVPRSSRRLRKSVAKLVGYMVAILLGFLIDRIAAHEWFITHRLIASFICTVELLSILENLAVATNQPVFVKLIRLIRGRSDSTLRDILDEKNE